MRSGFDIISFGIDYHLEGHVSGYKQCRPGWIQYACPYCRKDPYLGFNLEKSYFNCYYCGFHPIGETLLLLTNLPPGMLRSVYKKYAKGLLSTTPYERTQNKKRTIPIPNWWLPLSSRQLDYLYERGFDNPEQTVKTWGLYGANHLAPVGYSHRIIIPYYNDKGEVLCFTSRSISEEVDLRYKASSIEENTWDTKECLYGLWNVPGDSVIVLEGQIDVWKLGTGAVATGGSAYTQTQVKLLSSFSKRYIMYDNEDTAQEQAQKLAEELSPYEGETWVLNIPEVNDPGDLSEKEGLEIMKATLYEGLVL